MINTAKVLNYMQWVISIGSELSEKDLDPVPNNVVIVNNAPQIGLLKKAQFMINHGGANSVKECICLGVPMLVFPLEFDHFGNAAKVVHHKLGILGSFEKITKKKLIELIHELNGNDSYRENIAAMQKKFNQHETHSPAVKIIEAILKK
jgi:UDP:flavonoid glycosyltransferase YjiC (YdhE family)